MKKIFLISYFLIFTFLLSAQNWTTKLPQDKPKDQLTLFDYQKAFNDYWAPFNVENGYYYQNGVKIKASGWKQFLRWEWDIENQVDVKTGRFPERTAQEVIDEYQRTKPLMSRSSLASWTSLGTNSSAGGYAGVGRLNCIAFHPVDNATFWVGAPSGGLWVTKDDGISWKCLTDQNEIIGVSDILIPTDFATSNTIYIATGDKDHWDNRSIGVLKSTDGGSTWKKTGLSFTLASYNMVTKLLPDPSNTQTILAATTQGVYKTTNGGTTWNTKLGSIGFVDMEYKPGNYNTLYGSTTAGEIYLSTNGGASWTLVFSNNDAGRIELAVAPTQPTWVYALVAATDAGLYGIYKSTNSGATYTKIYDGKITGQNLLGWAASGTDTSGQGWYDLTIDVSPSNANKVFIGGINTWSSADGGLNWTLVNHWWGDGVQAVHADKHSIKFRSNGDLFECNDGGIYFSDNGTDFGDMTNGMVTSQMYKLGVSQTVQNEVITGLQDNGTKLFLDGYWEDVMGGDGMECIIDYTDADVQYGEVYYGDIRRTDDHWNSNSNIKPQGAGKGAWITPYIIDPKDHNTLYAGYNEVWKTTDNGGSWKQISLLGNSEALRSIAISRTNSNVICIANTTHIWETTNGGTNWKEITGNLPVDSAKITGITIKNDNSNTVWVTMGGYEVPGVYVSSNSDTTWTNISAGLPPIPVYSLVQNIQETSEVQLYAGTELGVYLKAGSNNWVGFNNNLPNVKIGELEIYYNNRPSKSKLFAATYGRGLWESNVYVKDAPMTFYGFTTAQNNATSVSPGSINNDIISLKFETENVLNPLYITQISVSMDGTTNLNDVSNLKIFYTGTNSVFSAAKQFGATTSAISGIINFRDSISLQEGLNYFWLTYDIKPAAKISDFIDAKGISVTISTIVRTPTDTYPSSRRIISKKYCTAGSSSSLVSYISRVVIGSIDNSTFNSVSGYQDYSSLVADVRRGFYDTLSVFIGSESLMDELNVWVDWNLDGDFDDSAETVFASGVVGNPLYYVVFAPPASAATGITRMRIRSFSTGFDTANKLPCGIATRYGEVEDYSLNVLSGQNVDPVNDLNGIVLYPNPAADKLIIANRINTHKVEFEIYNSLGQIVNRSAFTNKTEINLAPYKSGVYMVRLKSGNTFAWSKFIKE